MIDLDKARVALMLATLNPDFLPPYSEFLLQQTKKLDLVIEAMNWTSGTYSGPVVGQDDQAWLIKIGAGRAGVLSFDKIEEGAVAPRLGDNILLTLTRGLAQVVVLQSPKNIPTNETRPE
ncbi:MAG: hypothetical protein Q8O81_12070 [Giesbergeria sp.]|nr:hypothetical protein [Giesbergeria sp.]